MGWLSIGGSSSDTSSNSTKNEYGNRTPIISPQYGAAYNAFAKSLGFDPSQWGSTATAQAGGGTQTGGGGSGYYDPNTGMMVPATGSSGSTSPSYTGPDTQSVSGFNPFQAQGVNALINSQRNNDVGRAMQSVNGSLGTDADYYGWLNRTVNVPIANQAAPQASLSTSAGAPTVANQEAYKNIGNYMSPYTNQVVDTTLASYDKNTRDQLAARAASRGAGSAFGDRANISDSNYLAGSDLNRAQTEAAIRDLGFTRALQPSMFDAGQNLQGQTTNAANIRGTNEFNANAGNQNAQFNVGAKQTNTAQQLQASQQIAAGIAAKTGIDQQILNNIVTADGIDMAKAQALVEAGTISQAQLGALLGAAQDFNGSSFTDNATATGTGHSNSSSFGFSPSLSDISSLGGSSK